MGFSNFLLHYVLTDLPFFFRCLIISFIMFSLIYKLIMINRYEFFLLWTVYFGAIFSAVTVIIMYKKNAISWYYYSNFFLTSSIFYFTILFFQFQLDPKYVYQKRVRISQNSSSNAKFYTYCFFFMWLVLIILKIFFLGVRSFEKQGGGSGGIIRLLWVVSPLFQYSVIYIFFKKKANKASFIFSLLFIFASFFSNSKSTVLDYFFTFLIFSYLNPTCTKNINFIKKYGLIGLIVAIVAGIFMQVLLTNVSYLEGVLMLLYRFIAYGDIYTFAYPNDVAGYISEKTSVSFLQYLSSDFLTTFRLMPRVFSDECNIAGQLVEYVAGPGIAEGPNSRFNIVGIIFFGYSGSLFFSIFCGTIFYLLHLLFQYGVNGSYKKQLVIYFIVRTTISLEQDAALIPQFLVSFSFFIVIFIFLQILERAAISVHSGTI